MKSIVNHFIEERKKGKPRAATLVGLLIDYEIPHKILYSGSYPNECVNILASTSLNNEDSYVLFVAHHDVVPGSLGINDNTCSLAMLIMLASKLKDNCEVPLKILFTDREETGMVGIYSFLKDNSEKVRYAINFDVIGFGDQLIYSSKAPINMVEPIGAHYIKNRLIGDHIAFDRYGILNEIVLTVPTSDIAKNEDGTFYNTLIDDPIFYKSFHNRVFDNRIELINFELIEKLKGDLFEHFKKKK